MDEIEEDSMDRESNVEVVVNSSSSVQPPDAAISSSVPPPPEKVDKSTNTGFSVQKQFLFLIVHNLNLVFLGLSKSVILFECDSSNI